MTSERSLPPLEQRTLSAALERAVNAVPDALAQADQFSRYTFTELRTRSLTIAGGLQNVGAQRGHPVAFLLDNHLDLVHLWFALSLRGGVQVPINIAYKGHYLSHVLNDSASATIVIESHYLSRLIAVADDIPLLRTVVVHGPFNPTDKPRGSDWQFLSYEELLHAPMVEPVRVEPDDLMSYMYTSGTTGAAKGALLSHCHTYTHASRETYSQPDRHDRNLVTLPLFHLGGQSYGIFQSLIHENYCYVAPRFSVSGFWPLVQEQKITQTLMLGAMCELLLQSERHPAEIENTLDNAYMAPLPSNLEQFTTRFDVTAIPVYGSTEMGCPLSNDGHTHPGEAGSIRGNYDLRLIDESGHDVADGEAGELLVRPHEAHTIFSGYLNLPEKTAETIRDGWLYTGDVLRRDTSGRYYFADRVKDSMRRRGENISSFEVEAAINAHPDVFESAVLAVPSEFNEDEVKAVIVPRAGRSVTPEDITRFLVDRLPYFMVPRFISLATSLPKTVTMKIDKRALRDNDYAVWDRELSDIVVSRHS